MITLTELINNLTKYVEQDPGAGDMRVTIATEGWDNINVSDISTDIKKQFYITDNDWYGKSEVFDTERELEESSERRTKNSEDWYAEHIIVLSEGELVEKPK